MGTRFALPGGAGAGQVGQYAGQGGTVRGGDVPGRGGAADAQDVKDAVETGRVGAPLTVDDLVRVLLPGDRGPVGAGLGGAAVEEAGGEEGRGLVDRAGLLQQIAGGALAQAGGEALGQPVAPGQLGEGGDHTRVQPGGPAAHPPGGQRHAREEPVPAGVRQPDLFLGDDPHPVVHGLGPVGRRRGHAPLHLRGVHLAAPQQQAGDPADARAQRTDDGIAATVCRRGHGRVQPAHEAPGRRYVRVRRRARTGDDRREDGAQFAHPHPPQERGADDQDRRHRRTAVGVVAGAGYLVLRAGRGRAVGRVGAVLQPAVAVRGERYRGGRGDVEAVGEVAHQAVQIGGRALGDRDRGSDGGPGPHDDQGDHPGGEQHQDREHGRRPAGDVPAVAREVAAGSAREQDHRRRRGQHRDRQRPAADPQHRQRPGPRALGARLHSDTGHAGPHPLPSVQAVLALLVLLTPPLWHPPLTSQCRWAKCRNACAAP
ncbi:hypothetical protein GCM10010350_60800 [Streptomyces galilaeus]|nr:hypothetical protein GCM10010350_60800 [Streptomyces galilaeus]